VCVLTIKSDIQRFSKLSPNEIYCSKRNKQGRKRPLESLLGTIHNPILAKWYFSLRQFPSKKREKEVKKLVRKWRETQYFLPNFRLVWCDNEDRKGSGENWNKLDIKSAQMRRDKRECCVLCGAKKEEEKAIHPRHFMKELTEWCITVNARQWFSFHFLFLMSGNFSLCLKRTGGKGGRQCEDKPKNCFDEEELKQKKFKMRKISLSTFLFC
jgi:hypothetical protein